MNYLGMSNKLLSFIGRQIKVIPMQPKLDEKFLLIYHMGKSGSTAMRNSIIDNPDLDYTVYNVAYMSDESFKRYHLDLMTMQSMVLRKRIDAIKRDNTTFKVITMCRDAVGQQIAGFFNNIHLTIPNIFDYSYYAIFNMARDYYLNQITCYMENKKGILELGIPLVFHDLEVNGILGLDVYKSSFPKEKGYKIYSNEFVDLLLLKVECINDCCSKALKDFLDVDNFYLRPDNIGKKKRYGRYYDYFKDHIVIPKYFLDRQYTSKYTKHFYSNREIDSFYKKWNKEVHQ